MEQKQMELFLASIILVVLTTIVVVLRIVARFMIRGFWMDDYVMVLSQLLFITTCIITAIGAVEGLGVRDRNPRLNRPGQKDIIGARQKAVLVQITYSLALSAVKISICLALYRITTSKVIRWYLWFVMALSLAGGLVVIGIQASLCDSLRALWDIRLARTCVADAPARINVAFIVTTIAAIITDFSCAVIPYIILWRLQMPKKTKILLASVLGLSFLACAATLVRLRYIPRYTTRVDFTWGLADPYFWTILENAIAIIVGSVPSLRPLFKKMGIISTTQRSKPTSRRDTGNALAGASSARTPSGNAHRIIGPHLSKNGSEEYELLDADVDVYKNGSSSRVTTGERV